MVENVEDDLVADVEEIMVGVTSDMLLEMLDGETVSFFGYEVLRIVGDVVTTKRKDDSCVDLFDVYLVLNIIYP